MDLLGQYKTYNYVFYNANDKLNAEYERMKYLVLNETKGAADPHQLDIGILLEDDNEVIAGAFLNSTMSEKVLLILNIYVNESHRRNGIYTKLHQLIDLVARDLGKTKIFSNIHASNKLMVDVIMEKQHYQHFSYIVHRSVR